MNTSEKIKTLSELKDQVLNWKSKGEKIVFTNGCFDIMHLGHVDYLEKARNLGDRLVIGLNTDNSVSRIKGPSRPIINQTSRSRLMAALAFVDAVVFFDEETPYNLILTILPDILVKGEDYTIDKIIGSDIVMKNGGEVKTIKFVDGYSTSSIIEKIKKY
jgi:D-glycero-beta-D-manno-heptose 1-phosphate adenylyltransferase